MNLFNIFRKKEKTLVDILFNEYPFTKESIEIGLNYILDYYGWGKKNKEGMQTFIVMYRANEMCIMSLRMNIFIYDAAIIVCKEPSPINDDLKEIIKVFQNIKFK